ncbi:MAG: type pilus assembly protein PilC, partial [Pseudonocardiales bacterium]|nr:type pilus assembly protein PilC [Pseudonocardiales bacterium]
MTSTLTRTFDYEVLDDGGKRRKGKVDASNEASAAATLRAQGATPLSIVESGKGLNKEINLPGFRKRIT